MCADLPLHYHHASDLLLRLEEAPRRDISTLALLLSPNTHALNTQGVLLHTNSNQPQTHVHRLDQLCALAEQLELCQKSLSEYLDAKRCAFPRFFFISDEELLAILGSSDPTSVQEHLLKLFDNCAQLAFARNSKTVTGMASTEGETFAFRSVVAVDGPVEAWMRNVEAEMKRTLAAFMKEGAFHLSGSLNDPDTHPLLMCAPSATCMHACTHTRHGVLQ